MRVPTIGHVTRERFAMNPQTHPRLFRTIALVGGGLIGILAASCASGWPTALWH
jgi:hypothetical protein